MAKKDLRSSVVGVFINDAGLILAGQRKDTCVWQCPQGGIEENETYRDALEREIKEEIGLCRFSVIQEMEDLLTYEFPEGMKGPVAKNYRGQKQKWFLCKLLDEEPSLERAVDQEFIALAWLEPMKLLDQIIYWKRSVYEEAFTFFKLI